MNEMKGGVRKEGRLTKMMEARHSVESNLVRVYPFFGLQSGRKWETGYSRDRDLVKLYTVPCFHHFCYSYISLHLIEKPNLQS